LGPSTQNSQAQLETGFPTFRTVPSARVEISSDGKTPIWRTLNAFNSYNGFATAKITPCFTSGGPVRISMAALVAKTKING